MAEKLFDLAFENKSELYIYGTGIKAGDVFCKLRYLNVRIQGFIERDDSDRIGTFFWGKRVCTISEVSTEARIIVASGFWKEIETRLLLKGYRNIYVDNDLLDPVDTSDSYLLGIGDYKFDEDTTYIVCPYGIGDTLYVCAFLDEYKKAKNRRKVCAIVKKSHSDIPKAFSFIDEVIADDSMVEILNCWAIRTQTWELKNFLYGHFKKKLDMIFIRNDNVILDSMVTQYRREVMGLSEHSKLALEDFAFTQTESRDCLDANSIVLMPYANSIKSLEISLWERVASHLKKLGYSAFTNVKGPEEAVVPGTEALTGDISYVVSVVRNCKAVISLRSGLCDVLAFCKVPMIVLYSDKNMYREWDLRYISEELPIQSICTYDLSDDLIIDQIIEGLSKQ